MMSIYLHLPIICSILYIVWYLVAGVGNEGCQEELGSSPWWLGHWDWGILVQLPSCSWNICFDWDQLVVFVLVDIASSSLVGSDFTVCWMMHFYPTYRGSKLPLLLFVREGSHPWVGPIYSCTSTVSRLDKVFRLSLLGFVSMSSILVFLSECRIAYQCCREDIHIRSIWQACESIDISW